MSSSPNLPAIIATSGKPISIDRTVYYRTYPVGSAVVDLADTDPSYGRAASSEFAPPEYGEYAARNLPVFVAIRFRAANIGKLILRPFRVMANGEREEITRGNFWDLMQRPNGSPYWTFDRLLRFAEWDRCLWGSSFWVMDRGALGHGPVREVWRVRPDRMRPVLDPSDYVIGWVFEHQGQRIPFLTSEVLWLPMDNPIDEFSGLAPLAPLRLSVDIGFDAMRSNRARMRNGARIGGMVAPSGPEEIWVPAQQEAIAQQFRGLYQGVENAGRIAIMPVASAFTPTNLTPAEMEYLEQLRWTLGDAARAYGIAPESLGDHEHATYSNVEQAEKANWINTLRPEAEDMTDLMTRQFIDIFPGEFDVLEFDYSTIETLQEDRAEITDQAQKWFAMGVPLNRLLQEFQPNLLPAEGEGYPWGDVGYQNYTFMEPGSPSILQPKPEDTSAPAQQDDADNPARAALRLLQASKTRMVEFGSPEHERRWKRFARQLDRSERAWVPVLEDLFRRQQESVLAKLRDRAGTVTVAMDGETVYQGTMRDDFAAESMPFDRAEWERRFIQLVIPLMQDTFGDAAAEVLDEIGVSAAFDLTNPLVTQWLQARSQRFARQVNETTWEALQGTLSEGIDAGEGIDDLTERVKAIFTEASTNRARTIARSETVAASNAGGLEAARQSGVVKGKSWLASIDGRERDTHREAHGQVRGLEEDFTVGAGSGPAPGQIGIAKEDVNCRCTMLWVLDDGRVVPPLVSRLTPP